MTNPLCGYCKTAFESYLKILRTHENTIKLVIRFNGSSENLEHPSTKISARLIDIYQEKGKVAFIKAYTEWFLNRDVNSWLESYKKFALNETVLSVLKEQQNWSKAKNLNYTPATILDNKIFPQNYSYDDLAYFLNESLERKENERIVNIT